MSPFIYVDYFISFVVLLPLSFRKKKLNYLIKKKPAATELINLHLVGILFVCVNSTGGCFASYVVSLSWQRVSVLVSLFIADRSGCKIA